MVARNFLLFLFAMILFNSCQDDKKDEFIEERDYYPDIVSYSADALLKRTYTSGFEQSEPKWLTSEYEYDENGRFTKVSTPMFEDGVYSGVGSYILYTYNDTGQLIQKRHFNYNLNTPDDYWNLQTEHYTYNDEGLIIKELIEYPVIDKSDYSLFHYDGKQLMKKEFFYRGGHEETTTYEYKSGQLVKEKQYGTDGKCNQYISHTYKNGLLTISTVYHVNNSEQTPMRVLRYYYDGNHNLVHKTSEELFTFSSMMSSSTWYDYQ